MSESKKFDLVFRGDIAAGQKIMAVRERVQKLFKADDQQLERLFSGRPVTIRRDLDQAQAEQYQQALLQAGALVELKPATGRMAAPQASGREPKIAQAGANEGPAIAAPQAPAQSGREGSGVFTVAPIGADMLREEDRPLVDAVEVDISGLSAEIPTGDLLDEGEKKPVRAVEVDTSHLSIEDLSP